MSKAMLMILGVMAAAQVSLVHAEEKSDSNCGSESTASLTAGKSADTPAEAAKKKATATSSASSAASDSSGPSNSKP